MNWPPLQNQSSLIDDRTIASCCQPHQSVHTHAQLEKLPSRGAGPSSYEKRRPGQTAPITTPQKTMQPRSNGTHSIPRAPKNLMTSAFFGFCFAPRPVPPFSERERENVTSPTSRPRPAESTSLNCLPIPPIPSVRRGNHRVVPLTNTPTPDQDTPPQWHPE